MIPNGGQIAVDQSIVCFAESNPIPELYQWFVDDLANKYGDENFLLIDERWAGQNIFVRCIAINENIKGELGSGTSENTEFEVL